MPETGVVRSLAEELDLDMVILREESARSDTGGGEGSPISAGVIAICTFDAFLTSSASSTPNKAFAKSL